MKSGQSRSLEDIGEFLESLTWLEKDATCVRFNLNKLSLSDYDAAVEKYGKTVCDIAIELVSSLYNLVYEIPTFPERVFVISRLFCFDNDNSYRLLRFLDMALRVSESLSLDLKRDLGQKIGFLITNLDVALRDYNYRIQIISELRLSLIAKIKKTPHLPLREQLISFFRETDVNVVKAYIYLKRLSFTASPGLQKVREWFSQLNIDLYTERLIKIINDAIKSTGDVAYFDQEEIKNMLEEVAKNYGWLEQSDNTEAIIPQEPSGDDDYRIVW